MDLNKSYIVNGQVPFSQGTSSSSFSGTMSAEVAHQHMADGFEHRAKLLNILKDLDAGLNNLSEIMSEVS